MDNSAQLSAALTGRYHVEREIFVVVRAVGGDERQPFHVMLNWFAQKAPPVPK